MIEQRVHPLMAEMNVGRSSRGSMNRRRVERNAFMFNRPTMTGDESDHSRLAFSGSAWLV